MIVCFTILSLNLSITPALTVKASELEADQASQNNSFSELSEDPMVQLFTAVEKLPDELLQSRNKRDIKQFMLENDVNLKFSGEKTKRDLPGCIASISWVVVSTAFGVAKLAKVKQFVRATGGARKAAKVLMKIIKGGRSQENFQQFGKIVMDLSSEVLGIKDIKDNCV